MVVFCLHLVLFCSGSWQLRGKPVGIRGVSQPAPGRDDLGFAVMCSAG